MKDHDFTAVQMYWKPALLKLTQAGHVGCDGGVDTVCFIDPQLISSINRQGLKMGFTGEPQSDIGSVTAVAISSVQILYVRETPEDVAAARDKALGHEKVAPPPPVPLREVSSVGTSTAR